MIPDPLPSDDLQIDLPQPAVLRASQAGWLRGRLLECGCGGGANAVLCTRTAREVWGVDLDAAALERARHLAAQAWAHRLPDDAARFPARFLQLDVRDLESYRTTFDTVLDCGLLHRLHGEDRRRYLAGVAHILPDWGTFVLVCAGPQGIAPDGREHFTLDGMKELFLHGPWRIHKIVASTYIDREGEIPAWLVRAIRTAGDQLQSD